MRPNLVGIGFFVFVALAPSLARSQTNQIIYDPSFESGLNITVGAICDIRNPVGCRSVSAVTVIRTGSIQALSLGTWKSTQASSVKLGPKSGWRYAALGGHGTRQTSFLIQGITVPEADSVRLRFQLRVVSEERSENAVDILRVEILDEDGRRLRTLAQYSNLSSSSEYRERQFNLSRFAGQTIQIVFTASEDSSQPTWFLLDDVMLNVSSESADD